AGPPPGRRNAALAPECLHRPPAGPITDRTRAPPAARPAHLQPGTVQMTHDRSESLELPVLPRRDVVVFRAWVIPLFVGRDKSIRALDIAMEGDKRILLV